MKVFIYTWLLIVYSSSLSAGIFSKEFKLEGLLPQEVVGLTLYTDHVSKNPLCIEIDEDTVNQRKSEKTKELELHENPDGTKSFKAKVTYRKGFCQYVLDEFTFKYCTSESYEDCTYISARADEDLLNSPEEGASTYYDLSDLYKTRVVYERGVFSEELFFDFVSVANNPKNQLIYALKDKDSVTVKELLENTPSDDLEFSYVEHSYYGDDIDSYHFISMQNADELSLKYLFDNGFRLKSNYALRHAVAYMVSGSSMHKIPFNENVVELLVMNSNDINACDIYGKTILTRAKDHVTRRFNDYKETSEAIVKIILGHPEIDINKVCN